MHIHNTQKAHDVCTTNYEQKLAEWKPGPPLKERHQITTGKLKCHLVSLCIVDEAVHSVQFSFKAPISLMCLHESLGEERGGGVTASQQKLTGRRYFVSDG